MSNNNNNKNTVKEAIDEAGGVAAVAKAMRINSLNSIYKWIHNEIVPAGRMVKFRSLIPKRIRAKYPAHTLNPEVYEKPDQAA